MEEILKKARRFVPFMSDHSKVEFGGDHVFSRETRSYRQLHDWQEEGHLLLDASCSIVGPVTCIYSSGAMGTSSWETVDNFPEGEPVYLLSYNIKFDTEGDESATLYRIKKEE